MIKSNIKIQKGFSIVELMTAVAIGLIILTGLVAVFDTTSRMNRTQNGLARLQENGRFAVMSIKQNLEQAGYQYCLSSSVGLTGTNVAVPTQPWVIYSSLLPSGLPTRNDVSPAPAPAPAPYLMDTAYFIHGHECSAINSCSPSLTSVGSATDFVVPSVGTGDGQRIAGTDVLTFRYLRGVGKKIDSIQSVPVGGLFQTTINFTADEISTIPTAPVITSPMLIASCGTEPGRVIDLTSATPASVTSITSNKFKNSPTDLARLFDLSRDLITSTYYVANKVVDGRDIPTLFNVVNGTSNAIIEGVDRFDIIYGVQTVTGGIKLMDANAVQAMDVECTAGSSIASVGTLDNVVGCGWRSIVSIEVHLLLNTVYNSSTSDTEPFVYSIDDNYYQAPSSLPSGINHYSLFRREFVTSVTLKNY